MCTASTTLPCCPWCAAPLTCIPAPLTLAPPHTHTTTALHPIPSPTAHTHTHTLPQTILLYGPRPHTNTHSHLPPPTIQVRLSAVNSGGEGSVEGWIPIRGGVIVVVRTYPLAFGGFYKQGVKMCGIVHESVKAVSSPLRRLREEWHPTLAACPLKVGPS